MSNREKDDTEPHIRVSGNDLIVDGRSLDLVKNPADSQRSIEAEELSRILQLEVTRRAIISGLVTSFKALERKNAMILT